MKRFRRNIGGQFVVLAALLIATLTLSLALSIHQLNVEWQQLRYEPVEELVLGITSDLDRCLTHALSVASERYYQTEAKPNATSEGYNFISKWVRSIIASYSHVGIKMNMSVPVNGTGLTDVSWLLNWKNEVGLSQVYTKFDLDVDAYGFKGWVGHSGRFVMLRIFPDSITLTDLRTTLRFQIVQGKDQAVPIPNLTPESLKIWAHVTGRIMVPAEVNALSYLGGGNYTVTFTPRVDAQTLGAQLTVVTPEDNIYVSAYYYREVSERDVFVNLQSLEDDGDSENLGQIQLAGPNYTLPQSVSIRPGIYILRYFAEEGYIFLNWTVDGFAFVDNPSSSITSVTVYDNCTIIAFYRALYEKPKTINLVLDSREKDNPTLTHMGTISLNSTEFALPAKVSLDTGESTLRFKPDDPGQYFQFWESSGDVILASNIENPTTLWVNGNGTVIAVYGPQPPVTKSASVTLQSLEETLASKNLGNIVVGTTLFKLPSSINLRNGTYLLEYMPVEGYSFLNWTVSGSAFVENPRSSIALVTVDDDCTLTAFYRKARVPQREIVNLVLDSREKDNPTLTHMGTISLNSTEFALPADVSLVTGECTLQFKPENSGQYFQFWECSGFVTPASNIENPTTLVVSGNGTVVAVYGSQLPVSKSVHVALESLEDSLASRNLGIIVLGTTSFNLPNSANLPNGTYLLEYVAAEGYSFLNWTVSGSAFAEDPSSSFTRVTIYDNCTLTAFYKKVPITPGKIVNVVLDSRERNNLTSHLGMISLSSIDYALPANVSPAVGEHMLQFRLDDPNQYFQFWVCSGDVIATSNRDNPTTLVVSGNGTVVAVYGSQPPVTKSASVTLQSLEDNLASRNLGSIVLGTASFRLPNSANLPNGTYLLEYIAAEGYSFLNLTVGGSALVEDPSSSITQVTVDDDCIVTAFYKRTPITGPVTVNLSLDSREKNNVTLHLGTVSLGPVEYTLPAQVTLALGEYTLQFKPDIPSQYFQFWECSGDVIPTSSNDNPTMLVVSGNGTVVAVYGSEPPVTAPVYVTLQSLENTLASRNLGNIVVAETLFRLPSSTTLLTGEYLLEYVAAEGYTFLNWTTTGGISVRDRYSSVTSVGVNSNGTITAFYRGCNIFLDSRHWADLSSSLGYIKLGPTAYTLPKNLAGIAPGDYLLQYTEYNSSYAFLWWECSDGAIPWDLTSNSTTVTIFGDGTLIAVYYLTSEGEPPGGWDTLFLDTRYRLNPPFLWSGKSGKIPPSFSIGNEKQVTVLYSPTTPKIYLAPLVNVTAYIRPNPPETVRDINMTLVILYDSQYYRIGSGIFTNSYQGVYRMELDILNGEYPGQAGVIPEGSVIFLIITVTFFRSPWGTFFVYYGPDRPTNIQLYSG